MYPRDERLRQTPPWSAVIGSSWPPPDVAPVPAPHPPTYNTNAAPPLPYGGAPAFLPGHPTAPARGPHGHPSGPPPSEHPTQPIPPRDQWAKSAQRKVTLGDALTVLGGALVLVFSVFPFVSYTDERFVAVESRNDLPTSWTAWSPGTFLAPLSWIVILAAVLVAVLGVMQVLDRGHHVVFGLAIGQVRVLLAGSSFLILLSLAVSSKTVLFGDDRPQLTAAGVMVESTLSLDSGGYLMLLSALALLVGTVLTARSAAGPVVWPLPDTVRTMFAKRPPR